MKRILSLAALAVCGATLASCKSPPQTIVVHEHHYNTIRTSKGASVSGSSNSPEGFQAVTPPSSFSQ